VSKDLCVSHSLRAEAEVDELEALLAGQSPIAVFIDQIEEHLRLTSAANRHTSSHCRCAGSIKDCSMQTQAVALLALTDVSA
jgi:hypothetical protein